MKNFNISNVVYVDAKKAVFNLEVSLKYPKKKEEKNVKGKKKRATFLPPFAPRALFRYVQRSQCIVVISISK